jgi:hypothetical protein
MNLNYFKKIFHGKIFIYSSLVIFIALMLFITIGCEKSDYEKALSGEDSELASQISDTGQINETAESQSVETGGEAAGSSTATVTEDQANASETINSNIDDDNILKFIEKFSKIKSLGAFYSKIDYWSAEINIDKETGKASGFIFTTYTEAGLNGSSTTINTSVLSASLNGILDIKSLDFKGTMIGDIKADRNDYFSGPIEIETTGKLSEDSNTFTGNFSTPSLVIFDFTLKKS